MATTTRTIRVLIADDDDNVRAALRGLLDDAPGLAVVAEAATAEETIDACEQHLPDVAVVDVRMPGDGLSAARTVVANCPDTRVVVLTAHDTPEHRDAAAALGAARYVVKSDGDDLVRSVLAAAGR